VTTIQETNRLAVRRLEIELAGRYELFESYVSDYFEAVDTDPEAATRDRGYIVRLLEELFKLRSQLRSAENHLANERRMKRHWNFELCARCGGGGRLDDQWCETCDGSGMIQYRPAPSHPATACCSPTGAAMYRTGGDSAAARVLH
jgi:hypothetical protein